MINKLQAYLSFFEMSNNKKGSLQIIILIFTLNLFFLIICNLLLLGFFPEIRNQFFFSLTDIKVNLHENIIPIAGIALFAVLFEEIIYRLPIFLVYWYKFDLRKRVYGILLLTSIYSLMHLEGFTIYDVFYVLPYTFFGGICLALVFIVSGANKGKVFIPLFASVFVHFILNILFMAIQVVPESFK